MDGLSLRRAVLSGVDLTGAKLFEADLTGSDLRNAKLSQANLAHSDLREVDLRGANLNRASLTGANLGKANLRGTNLSGTTLIEADLRGAMLNAEHRPGMKEPGADLAGANLTYADLSGLDLSGASLIAATFHLTQLSGTNLAGANLSGANLVNASLALKDLSETDLSDANLTSANLSETKLSATKLSGANLYGANLKGAVYEAYSYPEPAHLLTVQGLSTMRYENSRHGLAMLRVALEKAGMRQQEREVTYALKHSDMLTACNKGDNIESIFNLVLFEWPSGYGMYPGRALKVLVGVILVCAVRYGRALYTGNGIMAVWPKQLNRRDDPDAQAGKSVPARLNLFFPFRRRRFPSRPARALFDFSAMVLLSLYFSVLSAFHIGWRELSLGTWLSRVQPREYQLVATGSVRTWSGIQSILSVYLIALWVLTYFGRLFE